MEQKTKETEESTKARRTPGPRHTNPAEAFIRILVKLPKSVREPTVSYALAVALAAPEPKPEADDEEQESLL